MPSAAIPLNEVFRSLTSKQRATIALLADGRTGKEMATILGISESAVTQRIETLRYKCGGLLRKDIAREWRAFCAEQESAGGAADTCNEFTGNSFHLRYVDGLGEDLSREYPDSDLALSDVMPFEIEAPWDRKREERVVPEVLDGENAALNRLFLATGLALGMAILCLILLAVSSELAELV